MHLLCITQHKVFETYNQYAASFAAFMLCTSEWNFFSKTKPKSSSGLAILVRIPRNTRIRQTLNHITESISWNSPDHRLIATIHGEIEGPSE